MHDGTSYMTGAPSNGTACQQQPYLRLTTRFQLTLLPPQSLQGASIVYALLSAKTEYNDKVSVALHMGPVAFITKIAPGVVRDQATVGNDMVSKVALAWVNASCFFCDACAERMLLGSIICAVC
jgi:hypothetical protein